MINPKTGEWIRKWGKFTLEQDDKWVNYHPNPLNKKTLNP
jgi:hypothetical protein